MDKANILVIEDDASVCELLYSSLTKSGYRVSVAQRGEAAMDQIEQDPPDLVVLDLNLPGMSGLDVCRVMRQDPWMSKIPVLMLTGKSEEDDIVVGLEVGADDYMTKPYGLRELLSRVRALLRRAYGELSAASANQLYAADLVIDLDQGQVWRGQQPLNLTPTELRLLAYLARHPGQALSRSQILEAVWGYDSSVEDERTVNVHIRRLREKVEVEPSRPMLILTVPGIGYRLVG